MQNWCCALVTIGAMAVHIYGGAAQSRHATQLLAQARSAIGAEGKLVSVRGLSALGTYTRQMPDHVQTGDLQIDVQLPDKLLRTDSFRAPGGGVFMMLRGVSGEALLRNSRIVNAGPGARMSRPPLMGATEAEAIANARADLARFTLALLLTAPAWTALEIADGGVAESPDGKADVLVATGAGGSTRLFFDQRTHRLLMLTYRAPDPRMFPPGQGAIAAGRAPSTSDQRAVAAAAAPAIVDVALFVDDHRPADGLTVPHRASLAVEGAIEETLSFKTIRINPTFGPFAFSDK